MGFFAWIMAEMSAEICKWKLHKERPIGFRGRLITEHWLT